MAKSIKMKIWICYNVEGEFFSGRTQQEATDEHTNTIGENVEGLNYLELDVEAPCPTPIVTKFSLIKKGAK